MSMARVLGPIGSVAEHATTYADLGLEIFPVNPADKTPLVSQYEATTDLDVIEGWWNQWPTALIGHRLDQYTIILDIDPRYGGKETWQALKAEIPDFVTRVHYSGREDGGGHIWLQRPADQLTITKLDQWARNRDLGQPQDNDRWTSGIDLLRREHRYTILPPSPHPKTGKPYTWGEGRGLSISVAPTPQILCDLLTADPKPPDEPPRPKDPNSIADQYSATTNWRNLLEPAGWTLVAGDGNSDGSRWRHPTSEHAHSATIRHHCLFVYSPNTPFPQTEPDEPQGITPFRAFTELQHAGDGKAAARAARLTQPTATTTTNTHDNQDNDLELTPASGIEPKRVRWCWQDRIPTGALSLLAGPEGLGKSTIGYWLAARLSRGELPGEHQTPQTVFICATEDSWAHTIVPRLMAHNADLTRIYRVQSRTTEDQTTELSLPADLPALQRNVQTHNTALLILDPLMSRLQAGLDAHRDGEVRQALEPLVAIAETTGLAILGLIHHNKSGSSDPLHLVMASKAFPAVARSVHTVIKDPDDETGARRLFGPTKNNLGRVDLPMIPFTIQPWNYPTSDGQGVTGQIAWGQETNGSIQDALARSTQDPDERTAIEEAAEWLEQYMTIHGPKISVADTKAAARAAGHSQRTTERAVSKLKFTVTKEGFPARGYWNLPDSPDVPQSRPTQKRGETGETGETGAEQGFISPKTTVSPHHTLPTREARQETPINTDSDDRSPQRPCTRCPTGIATDISGLCPGCLANPGTLPPRDPTKDF